MGWFSSKTKEQKEKERKLAKIQYDISQLNKWLNFLKSITAGGINLGPVKSDPRNNEVIDQCLEKLDKIKGELQDYRKTP